VKHAQLALLATQRDELIESEQDRRAAEVVREVGVLDEPYAAMEQDEHVEDVEQLVGGPEGGEDVRASGRRGEDVDDADGDHQQDAGETCVSPARSLLYVPPATETCGSGSLPEDFYFTLMPLVWRREEHSACKN